MYFKYINRSKVKEWENISNESTHQNKAGMAILISGERNFQQVFKMP